MSEARPWAEAATLIIAAKCADPAPADPRTDYQVLMLQRSGGNSFLPGHHVFPGGRISDHDYSPTWLDLFREAGIENLDSLGRALTGDGKRPSMLTRHEPEWPVPPDIAFRICAIRETFEESAVLLVRSLGEVRKLVQTSNDGTGALYGRNIVLDSSVLEDWRRRVMKDPAQFLELCKWLGGLPDIWSLAIWNNWLTPVLGKQLRRAKRFDTMFYVCCLNEIPYALHDRAETIKSKWYSPLAIIEDNEESKISLIGPQVYETLRLANFKRIEDLLRFSMGRSKLGCERYMPVYVICPDGIASLLPGDELYPDSPDYAGNEDPLTSEKSTLEFFDTGKRCNRRIQRGGQWFIKCTGEPRFGHVHPLNKHNTKTKSTL